MRSLRPASIIPGRSVGPDGGESPARLQLTSLVDMMVILVVFLLKSFSVEGQLVTPAAGLELPTSALRDPVPVGMTVEIGPRFVRVAGRDVLPTAALAVGDTAGLAPLNKALASGAFAANTSQVLVQADRRIEYRSLSRVLRTCAEAGWTDVSLVVLEGQS